jgi:predicted RNase H-like HicB family nuclease
MAQMVVGLIHAENGSYGISFPDFPGAVSAAKSADEAVARGRDTLAFHVRGMIEDGDVLPLPRSLEELKNDRMFREDAKDAAVVMVPLDIPGKSLRVNISMDENLIDAIDRAAKSAGQNRSSYLADAARARLLRGV